jgi:hypothetical protein
MQHTKLYIIIDRSGSMTSRRLQIVHGFNDFIQKQRTISMTDGGCDVSSYFFSDAITVHYEDRPIKDIPMLSIEDYQPMGMTALRDAMGHVYKRIAGESDTIPTRRIVLILTDGEENSSILVSMDELEALRKEIANKTEIIYMGSNQDAIAIGKDVGATRNSSLNYDDDHLTNAMATVGNAVARARSDNQPVEFTDIEREISSGSAIPVMRGK